MLKPFCKIFDREDGKQILVEIVSNESSEDMKDIQIKYNTEDLVYALTLGGIDNENVDESFEQINNETVDFMIESICGPILS